MFALKICEYRAHRPHDPFLHKISAAIRDDHGVSGYFFETCSFWDELATHGPSDILLTHTALEQFPPLEKHILDGIFLKWVNLLQARISRSAATGKAEHRSSDEFVGEVPHIRGRRCLHRGFISEDFFGRSDGRHHVPYNPAQMELSPMKTRSIPAMRLTRESLFSVTQCRNRWTKFASAKNQRKEPRKTPITSNESER